MAKGREDLLCSHSKRATLEVVNKVAVSSPLLIPGGDVVLLCHLINSNTLSRLMLPCTLATRGRSHSSAWRHPQHTYPLLRSQLNTLVRGRGNAHGTRDG
jgi:hypothetical protein